MPAAEKEAVAVTHGEIVHALARQSQRWLVASLQDEEPAIAVLHADYAVAYALALRQVADDAEIRALLGVTGKELEDAATRAQDRAAKMLAARCPGILPRTTIEIVG